MKIIKQLLCLILLSVVCLAAMVMLSACGTQDPPPDDPSTEPVSISGTYRSEYGTLTFDTHHVLHLDITEDFAKKSGLPAGKRDGTYVFLYRNEEWRYDKAETFRVTINGIHYAFRNEVGTTNSRTLAFILPDGSTVSFEKSEK